MPSAKGQTTDSGGVTDRDERRGDKERKRKEREEEKRKRWTNRLDKIREKTALMLAKAKRWKWLAIVLGLLVLIGMAVMGKFGGLGF